MNRRHVKAKHVFTISTKLLKLGTGREREGTEALVKVQGGMWLLSVRCAGAQMSFPRRPT